jgi:energy coupling factor transporter S component ThiW
MFSLDSNARNPIRDHLQKMTLAALFAALAVLLSPFSFQVGPSRCFPFQHAVNVVAGITLGPLWACGAAFVTSLVRYSIGTGTILAFPGSIFGALAVGLAAKLLPERLRTLAAAAEPLATSIIGAGVSAFIVSPGGGFLLSFYTLSFAFFISSGPGAAIGFVTLKALRRGIALVKA